MMFAWIGQLLCGMRRGGHDDVFHCPGNVIALKCRDCGRQTKGWAAVGPPPKQRFAGDTQRHRMRKDRDADTRVA
jgi:NAD-dependent SIR2 family protein deacetylase